MVASQTITLRAGERLSHHEATRLSELAESCGARTIILDLSACLEATTPALARFVLLRRELLASGRDCRMRGLRGQPAKVVEVHRLENVLPCLGDTAHSVAYPKPAPRAVRATSEADSVEPDSDREFAADGYADNAGLLCLQ